MKRIRINLFIGLFILFSLSKSSANPVATHYISEFMFDSKGWILELNTFYMNHDSGGFYLTSGIDTAYYKYASELSDFLVITADSLTGTLNINPLGDIIEVILPDYGSDYLFFGTADTNNPVPGLNQSLCRYGSTEHFYLDNSPTIGVSNDSIDATGAINGFVTDINDHPAINVRLSYDDYGYPGKYVYTDSSGNFHVASAYAKNTQFYTSNGAKYITKSLIVYPAHEHYVEIKLDWIVTSVTENNKNTDFVLKQNYPNPFNPQTTISFSLPSGGNVELKVFDELGNEIATLIDKYLTKGEHKVEFAGSHLSSGNYFYRLKTEDYIETKKFILLK